MKNPRALSDMTDKELLDYGEERPLDTHVGAHMMSRLKKETSKLTQMIIYLTLVLVVLTIVQVVFVVEAFFDRT